MFCENSKNSEFLISVGMVSTVIFVAYLFFKLFKGIRLFFFSQISSTNLKKFGKWAVVTGATDGIGKAYATELAKRGLDVILISRNMEKLKKTAEELESFGISTEVIQADFSKGWEIYPHIRKKLKGKDIGILVNNVGTLLQFPCFYLQIEIPDFIQLININMLSVVMMDLIVLPVMLKEKRGCIVNVSSISGMRPLPFKSAYSASKAFMVNMSSALNYEYNEMGIVMQSLVPSYISTKLVKFSDFLQTESIFVPNAETFASSAIKILNKSHISAGYWSHSLELAVIEYLPSFLWNITSKFVQRSLDSRKSK